MNDTERYNGLTLEQLVAMREREALRLPWIGPKVWAEAKRQASKRGGARKGAGAKAADGATGLVQIAVRVTPQQPGCTGRATYRGRSLPAAQAQAAGRVMKTHNVATNRPA